MQSCAIVLILRGCALSACTWIPSMPSFSLPSFDIPSFNVPGFNSPGTSMRVEFVPSGAEASIANGPSCKTPCTLPAPTRSGSFNVSFALNGYEPQTVPVRVAAGQINTWDAAESGALSPSPTVIEPDPVIAESRHLCGTGPQTQDAAAAESQEAAARAADGCRFPALAAASGAGDAGDAADWVGPPPAQQPNVFR